MILFTDGFTALVLCCLTAFLPTQRCSAAERSCHFVLNNADYGVVSPNVGTPIYNVCSWRVSASPDRKLVINLDRVYLFNENVSLTITVDDDETTYSNISCNEWERKQFTGSVLQIVYRLPSLNKERESDQRSSPASNSTFKFENSTIPTQECNTTYFEIRYKSFNPLECETPTSPVNGYTVAGKTNLIGEKVKYQCHTPYLLEKSSLSTATCVLNSKVPQLPLWSNPPPECILPECGKMPIKIPLSSSRNKTTLRLEDLKRQKQKNCIWEITSERNKYLMVQIEHLSLPLSSTTGGKQQPSATLELYDDRISERRLLAQLSGIMGSSTIIYTTALNKLIVTLRFGNLLSSVENPVIDSSNEMEDEIRRYGFTISISAKVSLCQFPKAPANGDVKGMELSSDVNKKSFRAEPGQSIIFYCNSGFHLSGSENASCLENGQWNKRLPICVAAGVLADYLESPNWETQTVTMGSDTNISEVTVEAVSSGKTQQSRISKVRRPHPQSTEDKNNLKDIKEDSNAKHSFINPYATPSPEMLDNLTADVFPEDDQSSSGRISPDLPTGLDEFDDVFTNYDSGDDSEDFIEDVVRDGGNDSSEFPIIAVILGVGIPLILGTVAIAVFFVYRKLYPVRMNLGRKFETFENPAYGRGKRSPGTPLSGTLLSGASLAQSPAELQRLTRQTFP